MTRLAFTFVLLAGCWQMTVYVGPRVDSAGHVGVELGASMGGAAPNANRTGALVASVDTSADLTNTHAGCAPSGCVAARTTAAPDEAAKGAIRGVVEWSERPVVRDPVFQRMRGVGWRAGVYAGVEASEHPDGTPSFRRLVGATTTLSPWIWGGGGEYNKQFITLGVQLAADVFPDGGSTRFAGRAALACDLQFWPKLR